MRRLTAILLTVLAGPACRSPDAHDIPQAAQVMLQDGKVVQPATGDVAAGYVTIQNAADRPDTLVEVVAAFAASAEVHDQVEHDGMVHMEQRPHLVIPAGGEVALTPGGLHVMFQQLRTPVVAGDVVAVTFRFSRAGDIPAEFPVVRYRDLP